MRKILIIDDDADLSFIISEMLESYGYRVTCAENAEKAFDILEKESFHLLLLDINLPDSTGFEICRGLKHVMFTGSTSSTLIARSPGPKTSRGKNAGVRANSFSSTL